MSKATWTPENDRKLLLAIIKDSEIKVNYSSVATLMTTDEWTPTAKAIENRMTRLKAMAKNIGGEGGEGPSGNGEVTAATPKGNGKKGAKRAVPASGSDDEELLPPKKGRKPAAAKTGKGKKAMKKDEDVASVASEDEEVAKDEEVVKDEHDEA